MYRTYKAPVDKVYPNIRIPEPRISKRVIFLIRLLGRLYLLLFFGIARIVCEGDKAFFEAFKRALAGKSRCIIAFRHPNGGEPQILTWFFLFKLKRLAAKHGVRFPRHPHAVFVYGYEVVRWGGGIARYVMPNLGAMPIHHSKIDRQGMGRIFNAITEGPYPLALAPEGQVSYSTDVVPRLEPGTIRIGFGAAERLAKSNPGCSVEVLPVAVYFRFGPIGKFAMERLLKKIEKLCGLYKRGRDKLPFAERVRQCRDHILELNEAHYQIKSDASLSFEERIEKVVNAALETAERMIGVKSDEDHFVRLYRIRQYCWDKIFHPELEDLNGMSRVERSIRDLQAGEAWYISRHQEIADFCWYFRIPLPSEDAAIHNKIEYVQNLWDFANRSMGGAYNDRVSIYARKVIIQTAPVINLSERLPAYHEDKEAAINTAMSDLEKAYQDCIDESNRVKDFTSPQTVRHPVK